MAVAVAAVLCGIRAEHAVAAASPSRAVRQHPGPQLEAVVTRQFQDAMAQGGIRQVSDTIEGCYRMAGTVPQAAANCLLLDVTAMLFDAASRKLRAQRGPGDPGPATAFLAVDAYSARLDTVGQVAFGARPRAIGLYLGRAPERVMTALAKQPIPSALPPPASRAPAAQPPAAQNVVRLAPGRAEPVQVDPVQVDPVLREPARPDLGSPNLGSPKPASPEPRPSAAPRPTQEASVERTLPPQTPPQPTPPPDPTPVQISPAQISPDQASPAQASLSGPIRGHPGLQAEAETIHQLRLAMAQGGIRQISQAIEECYARGEPSRQAVADCLLWDAAAVLLDAAPRTLLVRQKRTDPGPATPYLDADAHRVRRGQLGPRIFGADPHDLAVYLGLAPERVMAAVMMQPTAPPAGMLVLHVPAPDASHPRATRRVGSPTRVETPVPGARRSRRPNAAPNAPERPEPTMLGPLY